MTSAGETQLSGESKPPEATENSAVSTVTRPLARDLYDWASQLTSEAGNGLKDYYYWTPQVERLLVKLKLTKRALIGFDLEGCPGMAGIVLVQNALC